MSELKFTSRRSDVYVTNGMVATSQPLAAQIGLDILRRGGNAADAAVAAASVLNVTEPMSTSIGGDAFCLFYSAKDKKVYGLNGSGRSPRNISLKKVLEDLGPDAKVIPVNSPHAITVPGACAAMVDTVSKFGSGNLDLKQILEGAIQIAEEGYPVSEIAAEEWKRKEEFLLSTPNGHELLKDGRAPRVGELVALPNMAKTYHRVAELGKEGFYKGPIAEAIVELITSQGGLMSLEDLENHHSEEVDPISYNYQNNIRVFECPPNGQGLTALIALGILDVLQEDKVIPDISSLEPTSPEYFHVLIETLRIAFADTRWHVTDPDFYKCSAENFLNKDYLRSRSKLFNPSRAAVDVNHGAPLNTSNTVYISAVDKEGNACSFIISCYQHFGSAQVPKGFGFALQNRGCNFNLEPDHPNRIEPGKRPYHTIIPSMALHAQSNDLYLCYGVMGRFMQPQGHVQILMNFIHHRLSPQQSLDAPRFCISPDNGIIFIEPDISQATQKTLTQMGHVLHILEGHSRSQFGRGQIIRKSYDYINKGKSKVVLTGGSDSRSDGQAAGY